MLFWKFKGDVVTLKNLLGCFRLLFSANCPHGLKEFYLDHFTHRTDANILWANHPGDKVPAVGVKIPVRKIPFRTAGRLPVMGGFHLQIRDLSCKSKIFFSHYMLVFKVLLWAWNFGVIYNACKLPSAWRRTIGGRVISQQAKITLKKVPLKLIEQSLNFARHFSKWFWPLWGMQLSKTTCRGLGDYYKGYKKTCTNRKGSYFTSYPNGSTDVNYDVLLEM